MGKIEDILDAVNPLHCIVNDTFITCYAVRDTVDVFFKEIRGLHAGGLLFRKTEDEKLNFYFVLVPSPLYPFLREREDLMKRKNVIVFSGQNVFQLLNIDYSYCPKGFLEDLNILSGEIHDNLSVILNAFSDENIEETYNALIATEGNNEVAVRDAVRHYIFLPDW